MKIIQIFDQKIIQQNRFKIINGVFKIILTYNKL